MKPPLPPRPGRLGFVRARDPQRRPPRAAYALPTLFTAGNIFLGFLAIMKSFEGAIQVMRGQTGANSQWASAAVMIGAALVLDGLDGRIARMTNTTSDFGREMDSLADVIGFGIAPAVLSIAWGFQYAIDPSQTKLNSQIMTLGYFFAFTFLVCGAARLARFNVTTNPMPKNPGRPDRKYFVGLPIPAAAAMVASIVYATDGVPLQQLAQDLGMPTMLCWVFSVLWMGLLALLAFLMVSTWRYRSFKDLNLRRPLSPVAIVVAACLLYLIVQYSQLMLFALMTLYVGSGVVVRLGGMFRRRNPGGGAPNLEPRPTS